MFAQIAGNEADAESPFRVGRVGVRFDPGSERLAKLLPKADMLGKYAEKVLRAGAAKKSRR